MAVVPPHADLRAVASGLGELPAGLAVLLGATPHVDRSGILQAAGDHRSREARVAQVDAAIGRRQHLRQFIAQAARLAFVDSEQRAQCGITRLLTTKRCVQAAVLHQFAIGGVLDRGDLARGRIRVLRAQACIVGIRLADGRHQRINLFRHGLVGIGRRRGRTGSQCQQHGSGQQQGLGQAHDPVPRDVALPLAGNRHATGHQIARTLVSARCGLPAAAPRHR